MSSEGGLYFPFLYLPHYTVYLIINTKPYSIYTETMSITSTRIEIGDYYRNRDS